LKKFSCLKIIRLFYLDNLHYMLWVECECNGHNFYDCVPLLALKCHFCMTDCFTKLGRLKTLIWRFLSEFVATTYFTMWSSPLFVVICTFGSFQSQIMSECCRSQLYFLAAIIHFWREELSLVL
jgi:hypothetical protein